MERPKCVDVYGVMVPTLSLKDKWRVLRVLTTEKDVNDTIDITVKAEDLVFGELAGDVEDAIAKTISSDDAVEFITAINNALIFVINDGKNEEAC